MINLEFHKGSFCVHAPVFCQEGYCSGCEIYRQGLSLTKPTDRSDSARDTGKLHEAGVEK
ncbi:MAG: hypothetical protein LUQ65_05730 [Candidatus Helarchaeota archaeon]|nr:hypothetical protein [Candidatus Helarchaeota archaeon]